MLSSICNSIGAVQLLIYHASPKFVTLSTEALTKRYEASRKRVAKISPREALHF
jgi:hypothetical protein